MYRIIIRSIVKASNTIDLIEASQRQVIKHRFLLVDTEKQVTEEVAFAKTVGCEVIQIVDSNLKDVTEQFTKKSLVKPLHIGNVGGKYGSIIAVYGDGTAFYDGKYIEVDGVTVKGFEQDGEMHEVTYWAYTTLAHKQQGKYTPVKDAQFDSQSVYDYEITYTKCSKCNLILDIETKIVNDEEEMYA